MSKIRRPLAEQMSKIRRLLAGSISQSQIRHLFDGIRLLLADPTCSTIVENPLQIGPIFAKQTQFPKSPNERNVILDKGV